MSSYVMVDMTNTL